MTSPSTIRDLRAALEDLEEKKREIDEQYRSVAAALRYFEESKKGPRPRREEASTSNLVDAIYEVLTAERPLHRQQIYERLVEMGIGVGGQSPVDNVGAHLSRDPRFRIVGKGMWDLSEPPVRDESRFSAVFRRLRRSEPHARDESEAARARPEQSGTGNLADEIGRAHV